MIQNLTISVTGGVSITQRYPTIQVVQSAVVGSVNQTINTDNQRIKVTSNGTFTQIFSTDDNLWHTIFVVGGQVVCGPGEA